MYKEFAKVYDMLMDDFNYEDALSFLDKHINARPAQILEIACGSGNMTIPMLKRGNSITGVDISEEMLAVLSEKLESEGLRARLINMDATELDLGKKFDAIVSFTDGFNYIDKNLFDEFIQTLHNHLDKGGKLIFDVSTLFKLENYLGNNTFAQVFEDFSYIWENYYDNNEQTLEFDFSLFVKDQNGKYDMHTEHHIQYAYTCETLIEKLEAKGFILEEVITDKDNHRSYFAFRRL